MPYVKFRIAEIMRKHSHLPERSPLLQVIQEWVEGTLTRALYAAAMEPDGDAGPLVTRCACQGDPHYQAQGNLFVVLPMDERDFQMVHDYWKLPDAMIGQVTAKLLATTHLRADVLAVCRGSCDLWHVTVDRPVYVPKRLTHTVREA